LRTTRRNDFLQGQLSTSRSSVSCKIICSENSNNYTHFVKTKALLADKSIVKVFRAVILSYLIVEES
jgi:hypothetical protein